MGAVRAARADRDGEEQHGAEDDGPHVDERHAVLAEGRQVLRLGAPRAMLALLRPDRLPAHSQPAWQTRGAAPLHTARGRLRRTAGKHPARARAAGCKQPGPAFWASYPPAPLAPPHSRSASCCTPKMAASYASPRQPSPSAGVSATRRRAMAGAAAGAAGCALLLCGGASGAGGFRAQNLQGGAGNRLEEGAGATGPRPERGASPALSAACAPFRSAPTAARAAAASAASAACLWAFRCVRRASDVRSSSTKS